MRYQCMQLVQVMAQHESCLRRDAVAAALVGNTVHASIVGVQCCVCRFVSAFLQDCCRWAYRCCVQLTACSTIT
jgi:hypothetical protein